MSAKSFVRSWFNRAPSRNKKRPIRILSCGVEELEQRQLLTTGLSPVSFHVRSPTSPAELCQLFGRSNR